MCSWKPIQIPFDTLAANMDEATQIVGNQFRFPLIHWLADAMSANVGWKPIQIPFDTLATLERLVRRGLETNSDSL